MQPTLPTRAKLSPLAFLPFLILAFVAGSVLVEVTTSRWQPPPRVASQLLTTQKPIVLSKAEAQWLEDNPVIRVGVETDRFPMEAYSDVAGHTGLMSDYADLIRFRLPVELEFVPYGDFTSALDRLAQGEFDVITGVIPTSERRERFQFTREFLSVPYVVVTKSHRNVVSSVEDLADADIAVERGFYIERRLARELPGARLVPVSTTEEALEFVDRGFADAYVGNLWVASYYLAQGAFGQLVVAGVSGYENLGLAFAVRPDADLLTSAIDKALATVPPSARQHMFQRWIDRFDPQAVSRHQVENVAIVSGVLVALALAATLSWNWVQLRAIGRHRRVEAALTIAKTEAETLAQSKSAFLAMMSHEIRTPMNGVVGMLELLRASATDREQIEMMSVVTQSAQSLMSVINDILDFSKIDAGRMVTESVDVSVREIVENVADLAALTCASKPIEVVCFADPAIDDPLLGDPVRIRQVVSNLVSNAVKFTTRGNVVVRVEAADTGDDVQTLRFEVIDTGGGVDPANRDRLFQPFSQADMSTTRRFGGTGLGLVICRRLVEMMGGNIGFESEVGVGSVFWFTLPMKRKTGAVQGVEPFLKGLRVLVADWEPNSRAGLQTYLEAAGAAVVSVTSANDGLAALAASAPDTGRIDVAVVHIHPKDYADPSALAEFQRLGSERGLGLLLLGPKYDAVFRARADEVGSWRYLDCPLYASTLYRQVGIATGRDGSGAAPSHAGPASPPKLRFRAPDPAVARSAGAAVLVAEDNTMNQTVLRRQLDHLGIVHEFAPNGADALRVLGDRGDEFGLLLTDCHMPVLDGFKLARRVRAGESDGAARLPIVAMTADAMQETIAGCFNAGMDDFLSKPSNLRTLDETIGKWLSKAHDLRQAVDDGDADAPADRPDTVEAPSEAQPVVDLGRLGKLLGDADPEVLHETVRYLWETVAGTPAELRRLAEDRDAATLAKTAHAAKGACASGAAEAAAATLKDMQSAAERADWTAIEALCERVDRDFAALERFIGGLDGGISDGDAAGAGH